MVSKHNHVKTDKSMLGQVFTFILVEYLSNSEALTKYIYSVIKHVKDFSGLNSQLGDQHQISLCNIGP